MLSSLLPLGPLSVDRAEAQTPTLTLEVPSTIHSNGAELNWTYSGERSSFSHYEVFRSRIAGFTSNSNNKLTTIKDYDVTSFTDTMYGPNQKGVSYIVKANDTISSHEIRIGDATLLQEPLPPPGQATTILQGGASSKATYIASAPEGPCPNFGAATGLVVGTSGTTTYRSLLSFDLRQVPAKARILSASLTLQHSGVASAVGAVDVHRIGKAWKEGTGSGACTGDGATWSETEGGLGWRTPGADFGASPSASITPAAGDPAGGHQFDLTPLVQSWADGVNPNLGLLVKLRDETLVAGKSLTYSSDDAGTASLGPKLKVVYEDGSRSESPRASVYQPKPGSLVSGLVTVKADASDDRRVERVTFNVDDFFRVTDPSPPWEWVWDTTLDPNGPHTVTIRAIDEAENWTIAERVPVTVDNSAAPSVAITGPSGGATVNGTTTVTANASDGDGISKVEFYFDDVKFGEDATAPYDAQWNTLDPLLSAYDGPHTLMAKAYSATGQAATSAGVAVTVANNAQQPTAQYAASFDLNDAGEQDDGTAVPDAAKEDPNAPTRSADPQDPAPDATTLTDPPIDSGLSRSPTAPPPQPFRVKVKVKNNSAVTWNGNNLKLWYRWFDPLGNVVYEGPASGNLPSSLAPGQSTASIDVDVVAPALPTGAELAGYNLRFDLWDTVNQVWFAEKGSAPKDNPVVVNEELRSLLGLERFFHFTGEDMGAGMTHLVNVASGNSLLRWSPFSSPGRGLSTVMDLTYNSLEEHSRSPVGNNWSLSISSLLRFGLPLDVHPNKADTQAGNSKKWIAFVDGDGTLHRFEGKTSGKTTYWEEPAGVHLYLREYSKSDPARKWALTRPDRTTFFFDQDGFPTSVEDKNGNRLTFTLEAIPPAEDPGGPAKRITAVTDAGGRSFVMDYYSKAEAKTPHIRGKIQRITDHSGSAIDFTYYEDGNLLRLTQVGGQKADGFFLPDRSFTFTYTDSSGNGPAIPDPAQRRNPNPKTSPQSTRVFSLIDPRDNETVFDYFGPSQDPQDRWKLESRRNRAGEVTTFDYDHGRITTAAAPLGRTTRYAYDTTGKVTQITDPASRITRVDWFPQTDIRANHVSRITEPGGAYTAFDYNANGYLTKRSVLTDAKGAGETDDVLSTTTLTYQNVAVDGNDVSGKWKTGRTIPHISQLTAKVDPNGNDSDPSTPGLFKWLFTYDAKGNLTKVTDPESKPTTFDYNTDGTLLRVTDASLNPTDFCGYHASGQPTCIRDALAQTTQFGYDADGQLVWIQDPLHFSDTGAKDRQYKTFFDYDDFHRLGRTSTPKSTRFERQTLIWTGVEYDPNDNPVAMIDAHFGQEYSGAGPTTKIAYDPMDRQTLITGPDTSGDPQGERTKVEYDAAGRVKKLTLPNGVASSAVVDDFATLYDYDLLDRVVTQTRFNQAASGIEALRTHFCYSPAGDLTSTTAPNAGLASPDCTGSPSHTTRYTYDAAHRLLSEADPVNPPRTFKYDANGNVREIGNPSPAGVEKREYDQRDLLTRVIEPFRSGKDVVTQFVYDGVGNLTRLISPRAWDASTDKLNFNQYVTEY